MKSVSPVLRSPLKSHGGKWFHKNFVISQFNESERFVDLTFGSGIVPFNTPRHSQELFGDLNADIVNFFTVVRDEPEELQQRLYKVKFNEDTFLKAKARLEGDAEDPIGRAVAHMIVNRMCRSAKGDAFGWSERQRGGRPENLNSWKSAINYIPSTSIRLRKVEIVCGNAIDLAPSLDSAETKFYFDPPYLHETRTDKKAYGEFEMTDDDHRRLLAMIVTLKGSVYISGYDSAMYNETLVGFEKVEKKVVNHSSQDRKKSSRTEIIWFKRA